MESVLDRPSPRVRLPFGWHAWVLAAFLIGYCAWRARESVLLTGLPLDLLGLIACTAIALVLFLGARPARKWMLPASGALLIAKIVLVPFLVPTGWAARYYDTDRIEGAHLPSIDFMGAPWSRIEPTLDFEGNDFPLHFFNELRFNYRKDRKSHPFAAQYDGYVFLDRAGTLNTTVASIGAVDLLVDGETRLTRAADDPRVTRQTATVPLQAGAHQITVRYRSPSMSARKLTAVFTVTDPDAPTVTRALRPIYPYQVSPADTSRSRWIVRVLAVLDAAVLGLVAFWTWLAYRDWWRQPSSETGRQPQGKTVAAVSALAILFVVLAAAWRQVPHPFLIITTGSDAIAFEEYARQFVFGDFLLNSPSTGLHGIALLYTIGYHLLMSASHVLFGESLWHVLFLQKWLLWCTVVLTAAIAVRLSGWPAGIVAFGFAAHYALYGFFPINLLLRENLVIFMNAALVFLCVTPSPWSTRRAAAIGLVAGCNYLTDPINIGVVPLLVWLVYRMADPAQKRSCVQAFAVAWLALFLVIPLRNVLVTGIPTALPTEGAPTLWYGNRPPADVFPAPKGLHDHHFLYQAVYTYLWNEPAHFAVNIIRRALFTFGFHGTIHFNLPLYVQFSLIELTIWILAALGAGLAVKRHQGAFLILLAALGRWASIVIFLATERYVVTLMMLLIPLAAIGLVSIWRFRPLLATIVVVALGAEHYVRQFPELGSVVAWPGGRVVGDVSYHALRQRLSMTAPPASRLRWTFPADTAKWKPTPSMAVVDDGTPTFQFLTDAEEGIVVSPTIGVAAPLIKEVVIEARFTGLAYIARLVWQRPGEVATSAFFPVDQSGVLKTYRIPVWQAREWNSTIDHIQIWYNGDTIEPKRIELVTYPDVVLPKEPAPASTP